MGKAELARLLEPRNVQDLAAVLTYHVVSGAAVYSKDLPQNVKTLQGQDVVITSSSDGVRINRNSKVTVADIAATNGVVHIIDTVLIPPSPTTMAPAKALVNVVDLAQRTALSTLLFSLSTMICLSM